MKRKLKQKIGQAIVILTFNLSMSALLVFGFMQNTIYQEEETMIPTIVVIIVSILVIIFWHKKIDCETTWLYAIYVCIIVILYLFAVINI